MLYSGERGSHSNLMTHASPTSASHLQLQLAVDRFLAEQPRYPCCLLVHPEVVVLERTAESLAGQHGWPVLSVGAVLSQALLEIEPRRRPSRVRPVIAKAVQERVPGPLICTDIDLLFEPSLSLDPLLLLRDTSRIAPLFAMWPGTFANGTLHYASSDPPHAHYRAWVRPDLCASCIVPV